MSTPMTADRLRGRAAIIKAWNDLPDAWRCHPALKQLHQAAQECEDAPSPAEAHWDQRARFEAWYTEVEGPRVVTRGLLERVQAGPFAGDYRDGQVQGAWNVWQAATAANVQPKGTFTVTEEPRALELARSLGY